MVTATARYRESPLETASWNFSSACGRLSLDADLKTLLGMPYRELSLQLPVRLDDGTLRVVRASRVLHSNARGPAAGPMLCAPGANLDTAFALANFATWTAALTGVPFGGSCGVIDCAPASLTKSEFERLLRSYASRTHVVLGPFQDVAIASSESEAAILLEEYSALHGFSPASVTGKGAATGGLPNFSKVHPRAAALALRETAVRLGREVNDLQVAIYATPATIADYLAEFAFLGCTVTVLTDGFNTAYNPEGLTPGIALSNTETAQGPDSVLYADCDVLVLASPECVINAANSTRVRAGIVIEATPLAITPSADITLRQQRSIVIPDLLAASGPIIAAHIEWSSNLEQKQPQESDIEATLERTLSRSTDAVFERLNRDHSSLRSAANCLAVERVARTERLRGI